MTPRIVLGVLGFVALALGAAPAHAAKVLVAAHGVDSVACGTKETPCRSLSQAIANAVAGDTIEVGPGLYGDLDGDGVFTSPGEEDASLDTGCDCMIHVDKPLLLISTSGAGATILDAGGAALSVVHLSASGVVFGKKKKGFTLTGSGNDRGLETANGTHGTVVSGNRAWSNGNDGFHLQGDDVVVADNRASLNGDDGFELNGDAGTFTNNEAVANGFGFFLNTNGHTQQGTRLIGNTATENSVHGVLLASLAEMVTLKDSAFTGNGLIGVFLQGSNHVVEKCSFVGNGVAGLFGGADSSVAVAKSNFFGNGEEEANCGIEVSDADIDLLKTFWGSPAGPGVNPADELCESGSTVTSQKTATKETKVKVKAAQ